MFRILECLQAFALIFLIMSVHWIFAGMPNRATLGLRVTALEVAPITMDPTSDASVRLAGAWAISSRDPRFGGFSGLAIDRGRFVAVTDQGVLARFGKPGAGAHSIAINELPAGPGDVGRKSDWDSEALVADPAGRGWWVSFENRNQIWLYDRDFRRARLRHDFGKHRWPVNFGIEGLAAEGSDLLMFIEGGALYRMQDGKASRAAVIGRQWMFSDAALLPDGRLLAVERTLGILGFANSIVILQRASAAYRVVRRLRLPTGYFDNIEGIAPELLANGGTRLWMITDDNFQRPMRTRLLALDIPPGEPKI